MLAKSGRAVKHMDRGMRPTACSQGILMSTARNPAPSALELLAYAENIVASLTEGVVVFDDGNRVQVVNQALLDMLDLQVERNARLRDLFSLGSELYRIAAQALQGEPVRNEDAQYRTPAGKSCWLRVNAMILKDARERSLGTMLTIKEVSDLKRAEREIWQVEKMSALGRLAASVAHEVCNPLGAIDIQLQLLQEDIAAVDGELAEKVSRRLNIARAEMRRLDGIVQNFLRFSRPPALHLQQAAPNDLLRHIFALVEPEARKRQIELVLDLADSLPPITADENQLSQALLNILINAFQATGEHPRVALKSRLDSSSCEVVLEIGDNGHGIPAEDLERIFEFYYTTKDAGTGLGLSIAQRIVHQHGGTLEVESREGEGSTLSIRLPCSHGEKT